MDRTQMETKYKDGLLLPVAESFYTLQGEGSNSGKAAYFVRLGGCDIHCPWCDTKQHWNGDSYPPVEISGIVEKISGTPAKNVVITGGEPSLYQLNPICDLLHLKGYKIFLETSGTNPIRGDFDWICLSPKRHRPPVAEALAAASELKVVISSTADFGWAEENRTKVSDKCLLYLQPEWGERRYMLNEIVEYVKQHPEWRISLQMHKIIDIP